MKTNSGSFTRAILERTGIKMAHKNPATPIRMAQIINPVNGNTSFIKRENI